MSDIYGQYLGRTSTTAGFIRVMKHCAEDATHGVAADINVRIAVLAERNDTVIVPNFLVAPVVS